MINASVEATRPLPSASQRASLHVIEPTAAFKVSRASVDSTRPSPFASPHIGASVVVVVVTVSQSNENPSLPVPGAQGAQTRLVEPLHAEPPGALVPVPVGQVAEQDEQVGKL
jgi:hypothetical protein